MVNKIAEKRNFCTYSLDTAQELAGRGAVAYAGSRVEMDVENLGYSPADIHQLLMALVENDFVQGERYEGRDFFLDVYNKAWKAPSGETDDLYVKFKVSTTGRLVVVIGSFHRDR